MVYDSGGTIGRIPSRTTMHTRPERDPTQEQNYFPGQGAVEILWTK